MSDDARTAQAKRAQDYDPNPPRCLTCVYHRYEQERRYVERRITGRNGRIRVQRFKILGFPIKNPMVDRCTFGNFIVKPSGVCDEWHSRDGERIEQPEATQQQEGR